MLSPVSLTLLIFVGLVAFVAAQIAAVQLKQPGLFNYSPLIGIAVPLLCLGVSRIWKRVHNSRAFPAAARAAFPPALAEEAALMAAALGPWVEGVHPSHGTKAEVNGTCIVLPSRIYLRPFAPERLGLSEEGELMALCLRTRSSDGYKRQAALRHVLSSRHGFVIPFVVELAGEYVVEICRDLVDVLPLLDRASYGSFVRENRRLMDRLKAKATSYWDCYYRHEYPKRIDYPGLVFLHELERWAREE